MKSRVFYMRLKNLTDFSPYGDVLVYTVPNNPRDIESFWQAVREGEFGPVEVHDDLDDDTVEAA